MPHSITNRSSPAALAFVALLLATACGASSDPLSLGETDASHANAATASAEPSRDLATLRRATASFHRIETAAAAGYTEQITPCWEHVSQGAMGYHIGRPELIDGTVSLLEPELLIYEPQREGGMKLVGMEYIVPIDAWTGDSPPMLLGQTMHRHSALPIYKLHIWLWQRNPRGVFADWNPAVSCAHAAETETFE